MKHTFTYCVKHLMAVVSLLTLNTIHAQNANVTVNATSTTNGAWSGGTAGPYVFTPSANSATVLNTDIVNRLIGGGGYTLGNVTIQTACGSCTDSGNITINNVITAANANATAQTLTFNAAFNININANINLTGATGANGLFGANGSVGFNAANLILNSTNNSASVTLNSASAITITSTGGTGGNGSALGGAGGTGGTAGTITINAAGGIYMLNTGSALIATGGAGGAGGGGGAAGVQGNGNHISLTGTTRGLSIAGNLTATGTTPGNFTINDGNATVTTGGGDNDGQTAGVISGGNLTKLGTGKFFIGGTNTYTGTTTITQGTLRPTNNTIAPSTNGAFGNHASGIFLNGGILENNIGGGGLGTFSRPITVTANGSRIDAYGATRIIAANITLTQAATDTLYIGGVPAASAEGQTLRLSGIISNSAGTLILTKVGESILSLTGANTHTGGVHLVEGTLNINNASALGNVAGIFKIENSTIIDNTSGGAITTTNNPIVMNGNFTFTGTQALNLGTGAVTMNADIQITTSANTLTIGGDIINPTRSLTKAGTATLSLVAQNMAIDTLTVAAGSLISTSDTMSVNGNFTNNATFTNNNGTVILSGLGLQTVGGTSTTTFNNLVINNTYNASPQIILATNETVAGTLKFTNGNIDARTNSKTLTVSNNATGALIHTNGYVIGSLQRAIANTGSPTYSYPVGTTTGYTPADVVFNTLNTGGNLTCFATEGDHDSICSSIINAGSTVNDHWNFTNSGVGFASYGITFTYPSNDLDTGVTASNFVIGRYSGSAWSYPTVSGTPSSTSAGFTGETAFGSYAIGDTVSNSISYITAQGCDNDTTTILSATIKGVVGGLFSSTTGLAIDSLNGDINTGLSVAGTYTVTYTPPVGLCPTTPATATVVINASPAAGITNNTGVTIIDCNNATINVTATGGATYAWSGGSSINTATNDFTTAGVYSVTVTNANSCVDIDSITITEDLAPPTVVITNNTGATILDCNTSLISVTASGGDAYLWTGGDSTNTATNTFGAIGSYTVIVTNNSNGCSSVDSVVVTIDTLAPTIVLTNNTGTDTLTCSVAAIDFTASGADTYSWEAGSSPSSANNIFTTVGTYNLMATSLSNGCSSTDSVTIARDTTFVSIVNNTGLTELNCTTSSISVTATGGSAYAWDGGNSPTTAANTFTASGVYTVTVTNNNGCDSIASITISEDLINPTIVFTNNTGGATQIDCNNSSINVTASGGDTYSWTGGSTPNTATNTFVSAGTYSVTVTSSNGCSSMDSIAITLDTITPTLVLTNNTGGTVLNCTTTSINVNASGADTYAWTGGINTSSASNTFTAPAKYLITVTTTGNGCISTDSIIITQDTVSAALTNNTGSTEINCSVNSVNVTATGGNSYSWSGGSSPATAANTFTTAGSYSVTVTNTNGCNNAAVINITQNTTIPSLVLNNNTGTTQLDCNTSLISITASGGNSYSWTGGDSSNTATNTFVAPGTYSVTATETNGCTSTSSVTITKDISSPVIIITNNSGGDTTITCSTSSISVTASGGVSYSWTGGASPASASNTFTTPDTYYLTVTGSNGCTMMNSVIIAIDTASARIVNNTGSAQLNCTNSSINVVATGGTSYAWSGGNTPATAANTFTAPGSYSVTVANNNGCINKTHINITQSNTKPVITLSNFNGSSELNCVNSSINIVAGGGGTYSWTGGNSPSSASNSFIAPGTYSLTVTGTNGCTTDSSLTITQDNTLPSVSITNNTGVTEITCNDPVISLTAIGASDYSWSGGTNPNSNTNGIMSYGSYTVTGTASNGCTSSASIFITQNTTPPASVIVTNNSGGNTHIDCNVTAVNVTASGADYYGWSGGTSTATAANSLTTGGTFTVTGYSSVNGCSDTATITITQNNTLPTLGITNNTGSTVLNCINPTISVTATGNDLEGYTWSGGSSPSTPGNTFTSAGTYTVSTINSSNGCSADSTITITQDFATPTITFTNNTGTTILSCTTTSISVTASGADSYVWTAGSSTASALNSFSAPGTYSVTATGTNGCSSNSNIVITQNTTAPTVSIINNSNTTSLTCTTSEIYVTATGADSYVWSGGSSLTTADDTLSAVGSYTVIGTDAITGCSSNSTISVSQNIASPTINFINNSGTTLLSNENTSIDVTATGGASYDWLGAGTSPSTANNTFNSSGTYTVTSIGVNGCAGSATIQINQLGVSMILSSGNDTSCAGDYSSFSFSATPSNAGSNPKYQWRVNGNDIAGAINAVYTTTNLTDADSVDVVLTTATTSVTANSNSIKMHIKPLPATPTISIIGNTMMSSSTTGNQWYYNGDSITTAGGNTQFYSATQAGYYYVTVTSNEGCTAASAVTGYATGIDELELAAQIKVYPNPFSEYTTVSLGAGLKDATLRLVNMLGQTVREIEAGGQDEVVIRNEGLRSGVYFIQVISNGQIITSKKVVVE